MLGLEHTALQLSGNICSVLHTCVGDGKLQLGAKSYCPFWSFFSALPEKHELLQQVTVKQIQKEWCAEGLLCRRGTGCSRCHNGRQCGPPPWQLPCLQTTFTQIYKHHLLNAFSSFLGSSSNSGTKPHPCWPWTLKNRRKGQCLMFFSDLSEGEMQIKAKLFVTDFFHYLLERQWVRIKAFLLWRKCVGCWLQASSH